MQRSGPNWIKQVSTIGRTLSTDQLETAIEKLLTTERIVLEAARQPAFDLDKFRNAWEEFEKARV